MSVNQRIDVIRDLLKRNIKSSRICCCSKDGSFQCRNCSLVDKMTAPNAHACANCNEVEA